MLLVLLWVFALPAVVAGIESLRAGRRQFRAVAAEMSAPLPEWTPPVTLIVPVKGPEPGLVENLRSLAEQDYPDYELLIAVRTADDPAAALASGRARLVIAGPGRAGTGEKINNLLAAVAAARPASEILAFADSDGQVSREWLRGLVAPLRDPAVGAATGYRWYFPEQAGLWPLLRSVWNSVIAGSFGAGRAPFAWGGAMAVRREAFESSRVAEFWTGAVSDDYRLTQAIRAAGLEIRFAPRAMVASEGGCTAGEFLLWATRQIIITRVYSPALWRLGLGAHVIYCGAMALAVAAIVAGHAWAVPLLGLVTVPGMWRGALRARTARLLFPERAAWLDCHQQAYFWLTLPATWIWLYVFLASAFTRRIEWRGNVYELMGPAETRVVT